MSDTQRVRGPWGRTLAFAAPLGVAPPVAAAAGSAVDAWNPNHRPFLRSEIESGDDRRQHAGGLEIQRFEPSFEVRESRRVAQGTLPTADRDLHAHSAADLAVRFRHEAREQEIPVLPAEVGVMSRSCSRLRGDAPSEGMATQRGNRGPH